MTAQICKNCNHRRVSHGNCLVIGCLCECNDSDFPEVEPSNFAQEKDQQLLRLASNDDEPDPAALDEMRGARKVLEMVQAAANAAETVWQIETDPEKRAEYRGGYMALVELFNAIEKELGQ